MITVGDVRVRDTYKRAKNEVEKTRKALDRAEATELKKKNARISAQKKVRKTVEGLFEGSASFS